MTNRDKFIQNLSNEDLAKILDVYCDGLHGGKFCLIKEICGINCGDFSEVEKWLGQEVNEK